MKKIIHIITSLESGGAENMLYKLVKYSDKNDYYHEVISLIDEGVIGEKIKAEGVKIHSLHLNFKNFIPSLLRAKKICNEFDVVNTWLYHSDFIGFLIAKLLLKKRLIWNIRHSNLDKNANKSTTLKIVKLNSRLSKYVDRITYNSRQAYENHINVGYADHKSSVIPNGFELEKFKFNLKNRSRIREKMNFTENEKVLITVGRWNIQKDYSTLMKALYALKMDQIPFKLMMAGKELEESNEDLVHLIHKYQLTDHVLLLGIRHDIPDLLSVADLYVSSSLGESFSNAIGEAMAVELDCVVTDVGESKTMIGDTGSVVSPQDYKSLAEKLKSYLIQPQISRNKEARYRVFKNYEIKSVVEKLEKSF